MFESSFRVALSASLLLSAAGSASLAGQAPGDELRGEFPQLEALFNASDVTQGAIYELLVEIGESPDSDAAFDRLRESLMMRGNMSMIEMMQMNAGGMPGMDMGGPFAEREAGAMAELTQLIRGEHSESEARDAFSNSSPLSGRAASVILRGREFEKRIFDIYLDDGISDKYAAVNAAVDEYLSDSQLAVPSVAKTPALLHAHPFASAFKTGFPQLSGLVWAGQWLELASLEPIMLGGDATTVASGVDTTIQRYESKLSGMQGMSMLPSELPMVPAISPLLYSRHPEAAVIIDNLNMLETVIADLLVHPDVQDTSGSIEAVINEFTNPVSNLVSEEREYLLSALRGGIYYQGGPALGELARSERNRTRMEMEMPGHLIMPGMN